MGVKDVLYSMFGTDRVGLTVAVSDILNIIAPYMDCVTLWDYVEGYSTQKGCSQTNDKSFPSETYPQNNLKSN